VIENGVQIIVTQDAGTQVEAEIIGADRLSDLAVLQLPVAGYPSLPLCENGNLRAGD
jgi:S1-C subfamily serine protease